MKQKDFTGGYFEAILQLRPADDKMLNYEVGDEVEFIDEKCPCGRTSPRIKDVRRIREIKDKLEAGCEHW